MQRACGECVACCVAAEVRFETYTKPARKRCLHVLPSESQQLGRCDIHGQDCRPAVCNDFKCAWLSGFGVDLDRPDMLGVMLSVNHMNGGKWGFAVELEPGAVQGRAASRLAIFARSIPFPIIVASYEREPPHDTGDLVIVKNELLSRSKSLIGDELAILDEGVKLYRLFDHLKGRIV